jgi:hypothetical protein
LHNSYLSAETWNLSAETWTGILVSPKTPVLVKGQAQCNDEDELKEDLCADGRNTPLMHDAEFKAERLRWWWRSTEFWSTEVLLFCDQNCCLFLRQKYDPMTKTLPIPAAHSK